MEIDKVIRAEIEYYNSLPCIFNGFAEVPLLTDGIIWLLCREKITEISEKSKVPGYLFDIQIGDMPIGNTLLRVGYTEELYYSGQIGYGINEACRGNGYAMRACRLIARVARYHKMKKLIISNDIANIASQRVCEKLGARLVRTANIPRWHHEYSEGFRHMNIFEWDLGGL
ncbi:MAG: GNAT family N-acetyltransferase [Defluviitaleaceae bacterium]|nr:GNAT family N-acetyltransferase [Defluviitaleaceae bacterium]